MCRRAVRNACNSTPRTVPGPPRHGSRCGGSVRSNPRQERSTFVKRGVRNASSTFVKRSAAAESTCPTQIAEGRRAGSTFVKRSAGVESTCRLELPTVATQAPLLSNGALAQSRYVTFRNCPSSVVPGRYLIGGRWTCTEPVDTIF